MLIFVKSVLGHVEPVNETQLKEVILQPHYSAIEFQSKQREIQDEQVQMFMAEFPIIMLQILFTGPQTPSKKQMNYSRYLKDLQSSTWEQKVDAIHKLRDFKLQNSEIIEALITACEDSDAHVKRSGNE